MMKGTLCPSIYIVSFQNAIVPFFLKIFYYLHKIERKRIILNLPSSSLLSLEGHIRTQIARKMHRIIPPADESSHG